MDKKQAFDFVFKWEGGLSDHPADRGGVTKFGVSLAFFKDCGFDVDGDGDIDADDIRKLTLDQAKTVFDNEFWKKSRCDEFGPYSAFALFHSGVNCGAKQARRFLQRGINRVNMYVLGDPDPALVSDGTFGSLTMSAYAKMAKGNLDRTVALCMTNELKQFYQSIVRRRPNQKVFINGWMNRANDAQRLIMGG